jgi:beta-hydroxylase
MKYIILLIIVIAVLYVHYRGRVRYRFWRQLSDHSTFTAPLNGFMYLFSRVPNTPYLRPEMFPELAILQQNWQVIRDEGLHLQQLEQIKAADKYNDAGFNSFFKTGWKRFYLKWYEDAHPSASQLCPQTTALLRDIPSVKAAMFATLPDGSRLPRHRDPTPARYAFIWAWQRRTMTAALSRWMASVTAGAMEKACCLTRPISTMRKIPVVRIA